MSSPRRAIGFGDLVLFYIALFLAGVRGTNLGADSRYFIGFSLASLVLAALISLIGLRAGLQREPAGPGVMRIPGGRPAAIAVACVGLATTIVTITLSLLPPPDEPNKVLAVVKIVGLSAGLMGAGVLVYAMGRLRLARA